MSDTTVNQRHPNSTFQATYPYNQATITRSGHEIHFNDTPGHESIKLAHTKGTYFEIESNGRWVHTVAERAYQYIKNSFTQTIDSHYDVKIGGTYALNCDASSIEEIAIDKTVGIGGNLIDGVGGNRQINTFGEKFEGVKGNSVLRVEGDCAESYDSNLSTSVVGARVDSIQDNWSVTGGASVEMIADGTFRVKCKDFIVDATTITMTTEGGDVTITSGGKITVNGAAEIEVNGSSSITIEAAGVTYINGSQVRLND